MRSSAKDRNGLLDPPASTTGFGAVSLRTAESVPFCADSGTAEREARGDKEIYHGFLKWRGL
jgi:hypothetical protein